MSLIQIDWNPDRRKLREFAIIWLVGFGIIGAVVAWKLGCFAGSQRWRWPVGLWSAAALIGLIGIAIPAAVRPIYRGWMAVALPIGFVIGNVILAITYFGIFTPLGIFFRLIGRDALDRRFAQSLPSYWVERSSDSPSERYFRQF